ncbi:MAG TPA: nucleotidyltransferase domain-containing protein [Thermoanaerobaculia bacterium]|nr:nucleotidyltransferase domain-containing protein [Thermoanaerobaculia bacterium]
MRKLHTDVRPIRIEHRLGVLRELLAATPGLVGAYLFGSYGTPYQTPLSDVDLALLFRPGEEPDFHREMTLRGDFLRALEEEDVGIVLLHRMPSPFQLEVLSTGRSLYCSDRRALADFVERVLRVHADFEPDHRRFLDEYDRALRERYAAG